jgi:TPR repeat protein
MTVQGYDLVGDIHGHADALHRLLRKLDYTEIEDVFRHPERQMIFVGDFIDRVPQQREVLRIARSMCDAGAARAVMGNHEFNAIGWATQNNDRKFLRSHSKKNERQHAKFLSQIEEDSADQQDALGWFRSLPIWLDEPRFQYQLGRALQFVDRKKAFDVQQRLVNLRYPAAYDNLGWMFYTDRKNIPEAVNLFRMGTQLGDPDSMVSLAEMIDRKHTMPTSENETKIYLYSRAAAMGHLGAARALQVEQANETKAEQQLVIQQQQQQMKMQLFGAVLQNVGRH